MLRWSRLSQKIFVFLIYRKNKNRFRKLVCGGIPGYLQVPISQRNFGLELLEVRNCDAEFVRDELEL
jgi:hypothetical protein